MSIIQLFVRRTLMQSLVLSILTLFIIGLAKEFLPYSRLGDIVTDALSVPGALILGIMFPQGPHTGYGVLYWGYYVMVANLFFYLIVWYILLSLTKMLFRKKVGWRS